MKSKSLKVIPLGGAGEIGKNMTVYQLADEIIVVDAGLMFPDEEMLGVDIVIPDITYLEDNADKIRAIILTHGHEDHIGAAPYVLRRVDAPIYGSRLTLGLLSAKLMEYHLEEVATLKEVAAGDRLQIGGFDIELIRMSHSIPDSFGLAIRTELGTIVHTSDFKFDYTPVDGKQTDVARLAQLGEEGVRLLLTDCTNIEKVGHTPSESLVGGTFDQVFADAKGRIVIAAFASNIHRMQQVYDTAAMYERRVAVVGRSMAQNSEIAQRLGYLKIPDGASMTLAELNEADPSTIVIMTTGSQGEPLSALTKMAMDEHNRIKISEGDTVIISATPIPGNEDLILRTINRLFKLGAEVLYDLIAPVHVSGHGNQEDQKLMLNLVRPKYVAPVHGEHRHYAKFVEMARTLGFERERIFLLEVGDVLELTKRTTRVKGKVNAGSVMVDGLGVGDVSDIVLRDRRHLSQDGVIIVTITIDQSRGVVLAGPDLISRGFVHPEGAEDLLEEAKQVVLEELQSIPKDEISEWATVKSDVRSALAKFIYERTRRRPMIVPVIMEI